MSMLGNIFHRNGKDHESGADPASVAVAEGQAAGVIMEPMPAENVSTSPAEPATLDLGVVRAELEMIADLLGRGESYDLLKVSDENLVAIELPLAKLMRAVPKAFRTTTPEKEDADRFVPVLVVDLFEQLSSGRIETTVQLCAAEAPAKYLANELHTISEEVVTLPLPLVVSHIDPSELEKRTKGVDGSRGVEALPNIFSPGKSVSPAADKPDILPAPGNESLKEEVPIVDEPLGTVTEALASETLPGISPFVGEAAEEKNEEEPVLLRAAEEDPEPGPVSEPQAEADLHNEEEPVLLRAAEEDPEPEPVSEPVADADLHDEPAESATPVIDFPGTAEAATNVESERVYSPEEMPVEVESAELSFDIRPVKLKGVNLNTADVDELVARLTGVGPTLAARIVAERDARGPFLDLLDLSRVTGLGKKKFERLTGVPWPTGEEGLPEIHRNVLAPSDTGEIHVRDVVRRFTELAAFQGCIVVHEDGHVIADSWDHASRESLGAFAPQIFKKVAHYARQLDLGDAEAVTVSFHDYPITFVQSESIILVAVHAQGLLTRKSFRMARAVGCQLGRLLKRRSLAA